MADDPWEIVLIAAPWSAEVVAVVVALMVTAALARWSHVLREEVRRFGDSGRYDAGFGATLSTELRALASRLEAISTRLAKSRAGEEQLKESRRVLVSWVSDDLRSPLAALCALTEARDDVLDHDPDGYHDRVRAEVDRMIRIVDDLVELSGIPGGAAATDQAG